MNSISFTVEGEPHAKMRPRTYVTASGRVQSSTPQKTHDAEADIAWTFKVKYPGHEPWTDGVELDIVFCTNSESKDLDNMGKTVLDALNGVLFVDDRQVRVLRLEVVRKACPGNPRTQIDAWEVT